MDTNTMIVWIIWIVVVWVLLWIVFSKKWWKTVKVDKEWKAEVIVEKDWHVLKVDDSSIVENIKQKWWTQNEINIKKSSKVSWIEQW